jgi:hypothetical protein
MIKGDPIEPSRLDLITDEEEVKLIVLMTPTTTTINTNNPPKNLKPHKTTTIINISYDSSQLSFLCLQFPVPVGNSHLPNPAKTKTHPHTLTYFLSKTTRES